MVYFIFFKLATHNNEIGWISIKTCHKLSFFILHISPRFLWIASMLYAVFSFLHCCTLSLFGLFLWFSLVYQKFKIFSAFVPLPLFFQVVWYIYTLPILPCLFRFFLTAATLFLL